MPPAQSERFGRPAWERMTRIHQLLQGKKWPNCTLLSREFEVSSRTIKRDIEFMKSRLELPISFDTRKNGYFYERPVDQFPGVPVTEAEMFALLVAHKAIAQYRGTPFQAPLQSAFSKLTGRLDRQEPYTLNGLDEALSFRPFAPEDTDLATFEVLSRGVQERRVVVFDYRNLGTRVTCRRRVEPYHLACIENHWYLFARDRDRKAMRTFALTRLTRPKLTSARFRRQAGFDPDEYLRGSFTVFKGREDFEVVLEFDVWATDLIRGRCWHGTQEFTELPDGTSRLRLRLNNISDIEPWVLSWGNHATVIRPDALARKVEATAATLVQRYHGLAAAGPGRVQGTRTP